MNTNYLFFKKIGIIIILTIALDQSIGSLLEHFFFRQKSGKDYNTTYAIKDNISDILILGSSRANHHYVPKIFSDTLKMSYYNAGRDGNFMFYHDAITNCILARYKPKIIILDFNVAEFKFQSLNYDRISTLLPYYNAYPEMSKIIYIKDDFIKIKLLSKSYRFNSLIFPIFRGNIGKEKESQISSFGYIPLYKRWNEPLQTANDGDYRIDNNVVDAFKDILFICKKNNIKLYCVVSPIYLRINNDKSIILAKDICKNENIPFMDYSNKKLFLNNITLFEDLMHLNEKGAKLFSADLSHEIQYSLKNNLK